MKLLIVYTAEEKTKMINCTFYGGVFKIRWFHSKAVSTPAWEHRVLGSIPLTNLPGTTRWGSIKVIIKYHERFSVSVGSRADCSLSVSLSVNLSVSL